MSGIERSAIHREQPRVPGDVHGEDTRIKTLQAHHRRVLDYVRRAPDIRRDKVRDVRSKIASGSWKPASRRVAEKILYEHLLDSAPLYAVNLSRTSP